MRHSPVRLAWEAIAPGAARRDVAWRLLRDLAPGARLTNACPRCGGPHGPVVLEGSPLVASVSYAGAFAVVGVAGVDEASRIGIDAELAVDPRRDVAGFAGVLGPGRAADVRSWTRVESALKADGRGLRVDPALVEVVDGGTTWSARIPGRPGFLTGYDLGDGPPEIVVSAAVALPTASGRAAGEPGRSTH